MAFGAHRVLVVTGRTTARADPIREALTEAGISSDVYGVAAEPSVDLLREVVTAVADSGCDAVLGFGGGSALDVAKAAAVLATSGNDPMDHLEVIGAGRPIERPGLPCIAVPTTAGTGSEVTRNAVLSGDGVKASLRSPLMLPRVAVVDPDLLVDLPQAVIAASGMDALSQLIEPLLSSRANPFSDALARDGIRRSARSLRRAVRGRNDGPGGPGRSGPGQPVRRPLPGQLRAGCGARAGRSGRSPAVGPARRGLRRRARHDAGRQRARLAGPRPGPSGVAADRGGGRRADRSARCPTRRTRSTGCRS